MSKITNPPEFPRWGWLESNAQWTVTPCNLCLWFTTLCVWNGDHALHTNWQSLLLYFVVAFSLYKYETIYMRHMLYMRSNEYNNQYQTAILVLIPYLIPFALKKLWKLTYQASTSSKIQASLYCAAPTSCFEPLSSYRWESWWFRLGRWWDCVFVHLIQVLKHRMFSMSNILSHTQMSKFRLLRARVFVQKKYFQGWSNEETIHMLKLKMLKRVFVSAGARLSNSMLHMFHAHLPLPDLLHLRSPNPSTKVNA